MRLQKAITPQELALQKTLFESLLSKTGDGKVWFPVSTRFSIGKALNTKTTYFLDGQNESLPIILVRRKEPRQFYQIDAWVRYTYEALGYKRRGKADGATAYVPLRCPTQTDK